MPSMPGEGGGGGGAPPMRHRKTGQASITRVQGLGYKLLGSLLGPVIQNDIFSSSLCIYYKKNEK